MVGEIIELADNGVLDILPFHAVTQEVLDIIDEHQAAGRNLAGRPRPRREEYGK